MWARLMVGFGGSGLGLRASKDGLLRVAGAGCAGQKQQRQASSADVSAAWWCCVSAGGRKCLRELFSLLGRGFLPGRC